jgi:hypothetical protein
MHTMLTGIMVFVERDSSIQIAIGCLIDFAMLMISLKIQPIFDPLIDAANNTTLAPRAKSVQQRGPTPASQLRHRRVESFHAVWGKTVQQPRIVVDRVSLTVVETFSERVSLKGMIGVG